MSVELRRQSERRRGVVAIEARRSLVIMDQYKTAFDKTDAVTSDGGVSATGLTSDFLTLNDHLVQALEEHGIEVPLVPIGTPEHSFHSRFRTAVDHRFARPFPPYVQEYIEPVSHTRLVVSDKTERIDKRNKIFVPGESGFVGADAFFESARQQREDWAGTVVFNEHTGHPHYADRSFRVWSAEIDGVNELLSVVEMSTVLNVLTTLGPNLLHDTTETSDKMTRLLERMTAVQAAVERMEHEHSHIIKDTLTRLTRAIKKAEFQGKFLSETPTRYKKDGKRVYFYPTTAEFMTQEGVAVNNEEYLNLSVFALFYLLGSIPEGTLPKDLYRE